MREPILTDRLIVRDITEADAELLFDLDSDPEVMRYIGPRSAPDVAGYRVRLRLRNLCASLGTGKVIIYLLLVGNVPRTTG